MHRAACLVVVLVGCASSNFDVGAADANPDTGTNDTAAAVDTGVLATDSADPQPTDGGASCTRASECGVGKVCRVFGCGSVGGTCESGTGSPDYDPVCGCDDLTYWNWDYASSLSVAVKHKGRCAGVEGRPCGSGGSCPFADGLCVRQVGNTTACLSAADDQGGICWRLPASHACGAMPGMAVRDCSGTCRSYCSAVRNKQAFYASSCSF